MIKINLLAEKKPIKTKAAGSGGEGGGGLRSAALVALLLLGVGFAVGWWYLLNNDLQDWRNKHEEADRELSLGSGGRKRGMADRGSAQLVELSAGDGRGLGTSRALLQKGRYREATQLLEPLVERFPENARLRVPTRFRSA